MRLVRENDEGNYLMLTKEIANKLITREFNGDEKSIIIQIALHTLGHHCLMREINTASLVKTLQLQRSTVFQYMKSLKARGVIYFEKLKGVRGFVYGLNNDFFGRTYPGLIENVYYIDRKKSGTPDISEDHDAMLKSGAPDLKGPGCRTKKPPLAAVGANSAVSKYIINIGVETIARLSERKFIEFLNTRSRNSKKRWIELVNNILTEHPKDENHLWMAIQIVNQTNKDFLGNPIKASALGLFEKTEWSILKGAMVGIERTRQEEEARRKRQQEADAALEATKKRLQEEAEAQAGNVKSMDDFWKQNGGRRKRVAVE